MAITGPDVARKLTPSSRATICASVVLPSPGGPTNSTWSSASFRARAASMNTAEIFARLLLADELGEPLRPQRGFRRVFLAALGAPPIDGRGLKLTVPRPRLYLFGSSSPIGTTAAARPLGTMTRAFGS